MTGAGGGGNLDPGQRPTTADELLAEVIPGDASEGYVTLNEELTTALGGATARRSGVELHEEWAADMPGLKTDQARKIVEGHGARLRGVVDYVFGDEDGRMVDLPPTEQLERVIKLDTLVKMAAGHPVVVLKPGKDWLDIGLLARPEPTGDNTGLRHVSNEKSAASGVVLPVQGTVTVDIKTGREVGPQDRRHDDERDAWIDEKGTTSPVIDPLTTKVLLAAEDARNSSGTEPVTAYVLVGYTELQRTLNQVLGFEMPASGENQAKATARFSEALRIYKHLEQVGVGFDMDFVDGYLAYHIEALKEVGTKYRLARIAEMEQKLARLTDLGWIARPPEA
jgi:hypothetical protein